VFYNKYVYLCNKKGISPSAAAEAMGYQRSVVTRWRNGSAPREATLQRVAEYFGVTADCFLEDGQKETPAANNGGEGLRSTDYDKLNEANRAIIDDLIAKLVKAQSEE
jgi:transcriptional regulator with XRE-family HTH domain